MKKIYPILACLSTLALAASVRGEEIYVAQNDLGASNGGNASDAHGVAFFNSASNWGSGAGKISAGDTVHLVGTIGTTLTIQGSGSAGSPITILFEPNAKLSKSAWGIDTSSAIYSASQSYIVIDGNSSGVIECTSNGDTLSINQASYGITFTGGSNNTVQNLIVRNIYTHTSGATNKVDTYTTRCVYAENNNNFLVKNCSLSDAYLGVYILANGRAVSNTIIDGNSLAKCSTNIVVACGGLSTDSITNCTIQRNDVQMGANWYDPANSNHVDGIHTWTSGGTMSALNIHENYLHGDPGKHCTAPIYLTDNLSTCYIYDNAIVGNTNMPGEGYINLNLTGNSDAYILNNTIVGLGTGNTGGNGIAIDPSRPGNKIHLFNNIITNCFVGLYDGSAAANWDSDYNVLFNCGTVAYRSSFLSIANWKAFTGSDAHSSTVDPLLSSNYYVPSSPAVIGNGSNLSSLAQSIGINLSVDITDRARSSWDLGMVQAGTSSWKVGAGTSVSTPVVVPPSNAVISITAL